MNRTPQRKEAPNYEQLPMQLHVKIYPARKENGPLAYAGEYQSCVWITSYTHGIWVGWVGFVHVYNEYRSVPCAAQLLRGGLRELKHQPSVVAAKDYGGKRAVFPKRPGARPAEAFGYLPTNRIPSRESF